jgi:hypothetical protein
LTSIPSSPAGVYQYFCAQVKRRPGELNLETRLKFRALVGQFFIVPRRNARFAKLQPIFNAWNAEIEKQSQKRSYVKRKRKSITNDLWKLLGLLYWNHAAWIILRGEYKAMKKMLQVDGTRLSDREIEKRLKECYGYLSQVGPEKWYSNVKHGEPLALAYQDTAKSQGLNDGEELRRKLRPGRLRKSPPAALITASIDSKKLLSRLRRIPPFRRSRKDKVLIRIIKSEAH